MTYAMMGQWTQAIASWQRVVGIDPHPPQADLVYYHLGTAYWMTGNPIDARQAYQTALRIRRNWPQAYYQLGVIDGITIWEQPTG